MDRSAEAPLSDRLGVPRPKGRCLASSMTVRCGRDDETISGSRHQRNYVGTALCAPNIHDMVVERTRRDDALALNGRQAGPVGAVPERAGERVRDLALGRAISQAHNGKPAVHACVEDIATARGRRMPARAPNAPGEFELEKRAGWRAHVEEAEMGIVPGVSAGDGPKGILRCE